MLPRAQLSVVSRESDAIRMILGVALSVLAAAASLLLLSALPARPLQPEWLLQLGTRLQGLGPNLLIACLAIRLTPLLVRGTNGSRRWLRRCRLPAALLACIFLVLIPLQLISAERILQRLNQQELRVLSTARSVAVEIRSATDPESFRTALAQVVQPQTIPQTLDRPLSQLKRETLTGLEKSIQRTIDEQTQARTARRQRFWIDALRNTATAAVLCLGFAAVARL